MTQLSRRELLAWLAAGTATTAAGWSLTGNGAAAPTASGATPARSASERSAAGGSSVAASPMSPSAASSMASAAAGDRVLVVVEFGGGNDGLSTVVPAGLTGYYDARRDTAIAESELLGFDGEIGLHPALTRIAERGVAVVQGIGSHHPDGSHFEMMHRWWRGTPDAAEYGPGWIGRLADVIGDPSAIASAVSIGSGTHPIIQSRSAATLALPGADAAWYLAGAEDPIASAFQRGIRTMADQAGEGDQARLGSMVGATAALAERLVAADADADSVEYPDSSLARSLAFARQLVSLDLGVRVVHVVMDGDFDTHEGHSWRHPDLMATFDAAVGAFWDDADAAGLSDRLLLMTTSEFGRTLSENGSGGLDHGTASTALVMGPVSPGRVAEHPSLTRLDDNGDLVATVGFDSYLGSVVEGWMGVPAGEVFDSNPSLIDLAFA